MIKILHTSDWHLGKRLQTISRIEEQILVMEELCTIADSERVDAVIVAGDVYDAFNPATEAIELLYATLKRLSKHGERLVLVIAGNHDSPDRIEAPNPLAREHGIIFVGSPIYAHSAPQTYAGFTITKASESFIEVATKQGELLRIITAPFANEMRLQEAFSIEKDRELVDFLTHYWATIANEHCNSEGVNILVGHHLFLPSQGGAITEPDEEKPIQAISALLPIISIPPQIDYVALGHIHKYMQVRKSPPIVYCGSPLAYSFSESSQKKYVVLAELEKNTPAVYYTRELQSGIPLVQHKTHSVAEAVEWLAAHQNCYVELTIVQDDYLQQAEVSLLHKTHKKIVSVIPIVRSKHNAEQQEAWNRDKKSIDELFVEYFMSKKDGQKPSEEIMTMFHKILAQE